VHPYAKAILIMIHEEHGRSILKVLKLRHLPSIFSSHAGCQLPALVKQHEQHNLRK
ncbi:14380_t:CDS:2, partial [Funneliformis geosporum]